VSLLDLVTSNESFVSNLLVIVSSTCPRVVLNIARNSLIQTMQTPAANLYATATTWLTQIQVVLALVKLFRFSNLLLSGDSSTMKMVNRSLLPESGNGGPRRQRAKNELRQTNHHELSRTDKPGFN